MSNNMYELNSAKILKIGIIGTESVDLFHNLLSDSVLQSIKICQNFTLQTIMIENNTTSFSYNNFNFIFYLTSFDKLKDNDLLENIKKISFSLIDSRNHFFIVLNGCDNMEIDDDGDLVFSDHDDHLLYRNFYEKISQIMGEKIFHLCKISVNMSNIWKIIMNDSSIVNLTEEQINILAPTLVKKTTKMSLVDKKREIKIALKKINIDDKLIETGYTEFYDSVVQYFKILHQKKMVCQNYLFAFDKVIVSPNNIDIDNINNLLKEIYDIYFFKTEMHDDLIDKVDVILFTKLKQFYDKYKNNIALETNQAGSLVVYTYHKCLKAFMDIAKEYNLANIMEITKLEIDKVNNLIIDYHKKEFEKVTDLEKISSLLEIFANQDKNNVIGLFEKIKAHPKIMHENIEKMDKWVYFVDKCLKIGIPKDSIIHLLEEIILSKITFYSDISKTNNKDISVIYPQCLHAFLLSNINKNFVFKKLYMFISYSIRYSGRNIVDFIKNLKPEQYQNLLTLENKLLELCSVPIDEQSQPLILSEVDIVETFNEDIVSSNTTNFKQPIIKNIKHRKILILDKESDSELSDNNKEENKEDKKDKSSDKKDKNSDKKDKSSDKKDKNFDKEIIDLGKNNKNSSENKKEVITSLHPLSLKSTKKVVIDISKK
jgi:hypothetical protein